VNLQSAIFDGCSSSDDGGAVFVNFRDHYQLQIRELRCLSGWWNLSECRRVSPRSLFPFEMPHTFISSTQCFVSSLEFDCPFLFREHRHSIVRPVQQLGLLHWS
jgi:hypothetical protein